MLFQTQIYCALVVLVVSMQWTNARNVTIVCVFDDDVSFNCGDVLLRIQRENIAYSNISVQSVTLKSSSDIRKLITELDSAVRPLIPDMFLSIGSSYTTKTTALFAYCNSVPQVSLSKDTLATDFRSRHVLSIGPNGKELAEIFFYFLTSQNASDVSIIHDVQTDRDDFVLYMRNLAAKTKSLGRLKLIGTSLSCAQDTDFVRKLIELRDNGSRLIILHAGPEMTREIIRCAVDRDLFDGGHVWISTNQHILDSESLHDLPVGILSLKYLPSPGYGSEVKGGLTAILSNIDVLSDRQQRYSNDSNILKCKPNISDFAESQDLLRRVQNEWQNPPITYSIQNLIQDGVIKMWRSVGVVHTNKIVVDSIVWPGGFIYGPIGSERKLLRVATVPAPPFVQVRDAERETHKCYTDTPCLELNNTDDVLTYLDAYINNGPRKDQHYVLRCCSGLSIDILNRLSQDLKFDFVLYMFPETVNRIGQLVNGTWDGVIGQVYHGVADLMIGAFSITSSRSAWIDFTSPFYQSGFTMLSVAQERTPEMDAFLQPFSIGVWLSIIAMASVTAVVSSVLEWNSPFGLNPWGRNRTKLYTLGSSLCMVYSVVFGHTVATKSPKSWPCRFVQNVWAVFAIIFIASYTANLAAFLAGKDGEEVYRNPEDNRLRTKKLVVIGETSLAGYMSKLYPQVFARTTKSNIKNTKGIIEQMRAGKFDIFLHDLPILEYVRSRLDGTCKLRIVGKKFGDDNYGIGVPKGSEWKDRFSDLIMSYSLSGLLEQLDRKHFSKLSCSANGITQGDIAYGLPHTGGLFIMLCVAIGLSVILLSIEHCIYRFWLPVMRNKPDKSIFKNIHAMFISQRLYKSTVAKEIPSSSTGAKEIISRVKNKQFIELFQKEHRRAHRPVQDPRELRVVHQGRPVNRTGLRREVSKTSSSYSELTTNAEVYTLSDDSAVSSSTLFQRNVSEDAILNKDLINDECETMSVGSSVASRHLSRKMEGDDWPINWEQNWLVLFSPEQENPDTADMDKVSGFDNQAFTMNNERQDGELFKRNTSLKESDLLRNSNLDGDCAGFVKSYSWRPSKDIWTVTEGNAKLKQFKQIRAKSRDSVYSQKPYMKDNRTKSRIRRNTLDQLCKTFSVDLIDSFTLESLSKSELLVLWKASEINLKRQLSEMALQKESLLTIVNGDGSQNSVDSMDIHPP